MPHQPGESARLEAHRMSLGSILSRTARRVPDRIAFKHDGKQRSFGELNARVDGLANALRGLRVGPGDRVAVLSHNRVEMVEAYFATIRLGAICVPLNFRLAIPELSFIAQDAGFGVAICGAEFAEALATVQQKVTGLTDVIVFDGAAARPHEHDFETLVEQASRVPPAVDVDENAVAFLMYTSGTTGHPKGAALTHLNLLMNTLNMMMFMGPILGDDEVELFPNPMFHIAGLNCLLPNIFLGGTTILIGTGQFDAAGIVDILERERVTGAYGVPSHWQQICAVPGIEDRQFALRRITWGASQAPPSVLEALGRVFPEVSVMNAFGQTEMSSVTAVLQGTDSIRKRGSVGMEFPTVEVRIVDESMNDVGVDEVGEIVYRGPTVMQGYWNQPAANAEAFEGGWFHSGDLVRRDAEGYIYVVDRKKDMIITGGENVYSAEVEAAIDAHPKVAQVSVIGVPHERWVETPCAIVVPVDPDDPPGETEIIAWCGERIASYKKPSQVIIVAELPMNASGKVLKRTLREQFGGLKAGQALQQVEQPA